MVIDTSAFLAILKDEPDRRLFTEAIEAAASRRTSAATFLEASIVVQSRYGAAGIQRLDMLLESARIEVIAVDAAQARVARQAFVDFGKGRHPAGLNYGDGSPTRSPNNSASHCSARATTSLRQTSSSPFRRRLKLSGRRG